MSKYSKAIAAAIGGALAVGVAVGVLPDTFNVEETTTTITTAAVALGAIISAVITYASPKNEE